MASSAVVIVDLFGLERLTNAFGSLLLFQGVATIIGSPSIAKMYEIFNSYVQPFVITGIIIGISGVLCFVIVPLRKYNLNQKNRKVAPKTVELSVIDVQPTDQIRSF